MTLKPNHIAILIQPFNPPAASCKYLNVNTTHSCTRRIIASDQFRTYAGPLSALTVLPLLTLPLPNHIVSNGLQSSQ